MFVYIRNALRLAQILPHLLGLLLELLDGPLVNTTALVDQVTCGGRLAGVDVADDHDVDVNLLLNHLVGSDRSRLRSRL